MQMTCKIEGVEQFTSDLKQFTGHYIERPFIDKHFVGRMQKAFFRYMRKIFATEGAASGAKWKPLSDTPGWKEGSSRSGSMIGSGSGYKTWKAKKYPGKTILRREDTLYKSLTRKTGGDTVDYVKGLPHGSELWLGSKVPHGIYHDSTKPRSSNLPRRPIMRLSDAMIKGFHRIIQKHIARGIKKTMGKNQAPLSSRITELMH